MYKKPTADIILNDERLEASLKTRIKITMFTLSNPV